MDRTLLKGLALLEKLARSGPAGVTQLATEMNLEKSNIHRTLKTLAAAGYVRRCTNSTDYECTLKIFELGCTASSRISVKNIAEPHMIRLLQLTNETVHLSVLDGGEVIYIHKFDSTHPIRSYTMIGGRAPAYCVATGKALLAFAGDVRLRYPHGLEKFTERTITDFAALEQELSMVRVQGFAVNWGEWRQDVRGIGAAIWDALGKPAAAIGISGPASRLSAKQIKLLSVHVNAAAQAISADAGYSAFGNRAGRRI
ncbi:IclR family transcriptional regulator [Rhodoligotrophos defluvii]|uniref:IclR family transcriptional regulator n=1 Tax=Rhodoligotrophos defluvii TaxID=2561934 RepID=UPI0010C9879E|nr:IclR family transcriptional regulator [Rhodoligotrophos defluvii]